MFSTDNLFFLILFITPGAIFILFNRFLKPVPIVEKDETIRLSSALFFSFVVFGINSALFSKDYNTFSTQESIFTDTNLLSKVIILNIIVGFSSSIIWAWFRSYALPKINNCVNMIMGKAKTTAHSSAWVDIFEGKMIGNILDNCVVRVEKDGEVSTGLIHMHSSPASDRIEIVLSNVTDIQKYFEFDEKQEDEKKKYFSEILYVYIDLTYGFKITFYDMTKYKNHIKTYYDEKDAKQSGV